MIAVAICVVADLKSLGSQLRRVEFGQVAVALELAGHLAGRSSHRCLISIGFLWLPEWMGASSAASAFRRLCKPRPSMGSNQAGPEHVGNGCVQGGCAFLRICRRARNTV